MKLLSFSNSLGPWQPVLGRLWMVLLGLFALYVPSFIHLSNTLWQSENQAHGPIILMVVLYLIWEKRTYFLTQPQHEKASVWGWLLFIGGLSFYIVGRSQDIVVLDIGSLIPVLGGVLLITYGISAIRTFWFPLFFLLFMIPIPGSVMDVLTLPMKIAVSYVAEQILYWFDYPIARSGVVIQIGQYQLLVADACAGMHTLLSLEALGLLYLNIVRHDSLFRNLTLATLIIPISFTANVIRVIVLILVTYYFGDATGQGFIHGFAGMLLFVVALALIISVDSALQYFVTHRNKRVQAIGHKQ
ncbi:exosortase B [Methylovorus sp. MM2]|uniref:exosortase B n=1 Tax=Methylovorus sp. MM2 TaxID=1848038 RepID=UPI0007DFD652|nr:exosortase B [Methylovorus sp. MM2]OAM51206.1 exosortase B [Methylovorus sp. MM2]